MSIKRTVSFRMIYLSWVNSLDIILWGKRLVLPTLVNERSAQIFFESGAYVSKKYSKLNFFFTLDIFLPHLKVYPAQISI